MMVLRILFLLFCCSKCTWSLSECETVNRISCRNIYSARNCGMLSDCLRLWGNSTWVKQREDVSGECIFCMHNANFDVNFTFLWRLCDSSSACTHAYLNFLSAIRSAPIPRGSAAAVCNYLDLCHSHVFLGNLDFGSSLCDDCKKIVLDIQKLVADNATSEAISNKLVQYFCSVLPQSVKDYCSDVVKTHVPAVLRMIEVHINPEDICAIIGLCPRTASLTLTLPDFIRSTDDSKPDSVTPSPVTHTECGGTAQLSQKADLPDISTCEQCKIVLQRIIRAVSGPVVQSRLKSAFDQYICSQFSLLMRLECVSVVNEKIDELVHTSRRIDLNAVCTVFRMCPASPAPLSPVESLRVHRGTESSLPGVCQLCELVLDKLMSLVIGNLTEESINKALDEVCTLVPSAYKSDCDSFVYNYGGKIISALLEGTASKLVCTVLELCEPFSVDRVSASRVGLEPLSAAVAPDTHSLCDHHTRFSWIKRPSPKSHPMWASRSRLPNSFVWLSGAPSCEQCEAVFQQLTRVLSDPMVQAELKMLIDQKVCSQLPSLLHAACTTAINEHFDEIIEAIKQVNPKELCTLGSMCPKSGGALPLGVERQAALSPGVPLPEVCTVCEIVVDKLLAITVDDVSERSLTTALEQVCDFVPMAYTTKCHLLVDTFGAEIIKAILHDVAPNAICRLIQLCVPDSIASAITDDAKTIRHAHGLNGATCEACKLIINAIKYQLEQNDTEVKIDVLVKRMCEELPTSYVDECKSLVDKYLSTVIRYLEASMTAEEVCQEFNLCSVNTTTIHPAICLRGPSLWYSSVPLAIMCNAMRFWQYFVQQERSQTGLEGVCSSRNLDYICSSTEMEHMCNRINECTRHRASQYLLLVSQHLQDNVMQKPVNVESSVIYNCTICELLIARMKLHTKLFRRTIVSQSFCYEFKDTNDKKQCDAVMKWRHQLYGALRYETDKQKICKSMLLCKPQLNESIGDNVSALALACASGPLFFCSSRRTAEACGMTKFCSTLGWFSGDQMVTTPEQAGLVLDRFGQNVCRWGPVYWCQSLENARRCGPDAVKKCETLAWLKPGKSKANNCSNGPSYWCRSLETARSCGPYAVNYCRQQRLMHPITST